MNADRIWGARSEAPLTGLGRRQAEAEGKKAKELGLKFDLIISSPLTRARQTAKIIAKQVGYPDNDIIYNDRFVERAVGILEGTPYDDFFKNHRYEEMDKVEGAETNEELQQRAKQAHDYLLGLPHEKILVVSHGAFGRALRRVINSLPHTHEYIEHTSIPHAEIISWL